MWSANAAAGEPQHEGCGTSGKFPRYPSLALWLRRLRPNHGETLLGRSPGDPMAVADEQALIRILVVDDDPGDRRAVCRALAAPFSVLEAENGEQALRMVREEPPHCVLLDHQIPGTDTPRLLAELSTQLPVVMLTSPGDESAAVALLRAGALDYLIKNEFTGDSLQHSIHVAMAKMPDRRRPAQPRQRLLSHYQQEKQKREHLETALLIAHDIQQNLIPARPPDLPGFDVAGVSVPAEATGGDFFDYVRLADGRTAIVVADVSGHGTGPALLAAETRAYTRALACSHAD